jgi:flagellar protein FliL
MLIILVTLTLLGIVAVILLTQLNKETTNEGPPIEDVIEASVDIPEITTNLSDGGYAKVALKIETDSKKAGEELTLRVFQVNNIVIQELSEMEEADLHGKQGKVLFEKAIKAQINELMHEGEVVQVYMTSFIIQ